MNIVKRTSLFFSLAVAALVLGSVCSSFAAERKVYFDVDGIT